MGRNRRQFLIASGALLVPLRARSQQVSRFRRIGYIGINDRNHPAAQQFRLGMTNALAKLGYKEGENLHVEWLYAHGRPEQLQRLAEELVGANVELIISPLNAVTIAAQRTTKSIPIVMLTSTHPVENGIITSYARPGGNVTGLDTWPTAQMFEKMVEILKLAVPRAKVAVSLTTIQEPTQHLYKEAEARVKASLGISLQTVTMQRAEDLPGALKKIAALRPDALFVGSGRVISPHYREIVEFTIRHKLVSISAAPTFPSIGGLLGYGIAIPAIWERSASYVDRILRGAKPADLPVEQPTTYELILNLTTAKAIDLRLSPAFLARVDRTIE